MAITEQLGQRIGSQYLYEKKVKEMRSKGYSAGTVICNADGSVNVLWVDSANYEMKPLQVPKRRMSMHPALGMPYGNNR